MTASNLPQTNGDAFTPTDAYLQESHNRPTAVIVHGGAWNVPERLHEACLNGVKRAACEAYKALTAIKNPKCIKAISTDNKNALDAAEIAVRSLESNESFDAGRGSCLTSIGTVEMDAAMLCTTPGSKFLSIGSVAAITSVLHPVSVARKVLEFEKHSLLVGSQADKFAMENGVEMIKDIKELVTDEAKKEWELYQHDNYALVVDDNFNNNNIHNHNNNFINTGHDTVGAVVIDINGTIACATSTGGITGKMAGRVGDTPIVGAGLYALDGIGGLVATGHGESILRAVLCKHAVDNMVMKNTDFFKAVPESLEFMKEVSNGGCGGVVALDSKGRFTTHFTTPYMPWACVDDKGKLWAGIRRGEAVNYGKAELFL